MHKEVATKLIKKRQLKNKYQTNNELKLISLFYLLKNVSTTGVIINYAKHLTSISAYVQLSQSTLYTHLNGLIELGLVTKKSNNLVLSSFKKLFELYEIEEGSTLIEIKYNPSTHKFYQLLEFSTLADNMFRQELVIKKKLEKSPYTLELLESYAKQSTTKKTLQLAQKHAFVNGSNELENLFFINPNVVITWKRLFKEFNFKSYKSVAYLKKKLQKNNIVSIDKNGFFTSKVGAKTKAYNEGKEKNVSTCRYNKSINKTQKQFADNWNLCPNLYGFSMYYKN